MLKGLPIWPRMTVAGMLWGAAVGASVGMLVVVVMVASGVAGEGLYWDNAVQLMIGVPMYGIMAGILGAAIGCMLGVATGAIAGLVLLTTLRFLEPPAAVVATVVLVVSIQAATAVMISKGDWTLWTLPVLAVVPLALCTIGAAREWADPTVHADRRDTLAA